MNDMARILKKLKENQGEVHVLATVVRVVGSAYRREGAKMLIGQGFRLYGTVSGGCLEEDLWHHAQEVFETGRTKFVTYDLKHDNDLLWGRGLGCNGTIDVFLEPIQWNLQWTQVERWMAAGKRVVSITTLEGDQRQSQLFWDGTDIVGNGDLEWAAMKPEVKKFMNTARKVKWEGDWLLEGFVPKHILYIFGAGSDAEPLAELASKLDFDIRLVDPRENRCHHSHFPMADQCIVEHPNQFLTHHTLPPHSFVIIMTHSFQWDQEILQHLLNHPPRYLGILGPRQRTERLLKGQEIPEWIHSPVGLNILAEGPEEISVSIMAELLLVRNGQK